ncbi:CG30196, partial [Drosophila busckii]
MASTESLDGSACEFGGVAAVPQVAHLPTEPMEFVCPACQQLQTSQVQREAVTLLQKLACSINYLLCCYPIRWQGREDINHYCSACGCFIGRHISLSWYKRALFRMQRAEVEDHGRWVRFKAVEKEQLDEQKLGKQRAAL